MILGVLGDIKMNNQTGNKRYAVGDDSRVNITHRSKCFFGVTSEIPRPETETLFPDVWQNITIWR